MSRNAALKNLSRYRNDIDPDARLAAVTRMWVQAEAVKEQRRRERGWAFALMDASGAKPVVTHGLPKTWEIDTVEQHRLYNRAMKAQKAYRAAVTEARGLRCSIARLVRDSVGVDVEADAELEAAYKGMAR